MKKGKKRLSEPQENQTAGTMKENDTRVHGPEKARHPGESASTPPAALERGDPALHGV